MMGHCTACSAEITPADGPCLLWAPDNSPEPRRSFHLACWLQQAANEPQAEPREPIAAQ